MTTRRLATTAALTLALTLSACGNDTAESTAGGSSHGGGHSSGEGTSAGSKDVTAEGNEADVAFLSGMTPHHAQAVEMSELVLASDPSPEVAAVAQQIRDAQGPEITQMKDMLRELGVDAAGEGHGGGGHGGGSHGGMMSEQDLAALETATGADASRLYLTAMIAHHEGAIEASRAQVADGTYPPAIALAKSIAAEQEREIATMQGLLADL